MPDAPSAATPPAAPRPPDTPRFSVYIPVWNGAAWIGRAIESLLGQTERDWELVIGDNASDDDTASAVARYDDPRIRYHRWPDFVDIFENHNRTMLLCRGDWVQLLAADDRLHPACLERMAERIDGAARAGTPLSAVVTACRRVAPDGTDADREWYQTGRIAHVRDGMHDAGQWLMSMTGAASLPWNSGSVTVNRSMLHEAGGLFRPETGVCADLELYLRLCTYGGVEYVAEPLLDFTVYGASDGASRVRRNLEAGDPFGPMGIALVAGLAVHENRRTVPRRERAAVHAAVARELLSRALLHRYHEGGQGRRGAIRDIGRALRWSPRTCLSPRQATKAAAAILAPRAVIDRGRAALLSRRRTPSPPSVSRRPG